jgi:hypothetical protein
MELGDSCCKYNDSWNDLSGHPCLMGIYAVGKCAFGYHISKLWLIWIILVIVYDIFFNSASFFRRVILAPVSGMQ